MNYRNQILDVDLDAFNYCANPTQSIWDLVDSLPRNIPASLVIEHQQVLPAIRKLIKNRFSGFGRPIDYFHVDEHHDLYGDCPKRKPGKVNCGNYVYFLPVKKISSFTWVYPARHACDEDWCYSRKWLKDQGITVQKTIKHSWNPDKVALAVFAISPDYCSRNVMSDMGTILSYITQHFKLDHAVYRRPSYQPYSIRGWARRKRK